MAYKPSWPIYQLSRGYQQFGTSQLNITFWPVYQISEVYQLSRYHGLSNLYINYYSWFTFLAYLSIMAVRAYMSLVSPNPPSTIGYGDFVKKTRIVLTRHKIDY